MKNVIIIGAGPAGISAALYCKRAGIETSVIYLNSSALSKAHMIENYYGLMPISGEVLYERGIAQAQNLGINLYEEEVVDISWENEFIVTTTKNKHQAQALILATGKQRKAPPIKNLNNLEGKGVSYCAVCDGFFFRDKKIGVLGNGEYAAHEASYLSSLSKDITIFTNGESIESNELRNYPIIEDKIINLNGESKLESIQTNNNTYEVDGLFIAQGTAGTDSLCLKMGVISENGNIAVNEKMETNIPFLYACGDCNGGMLQVAKAVYEGALAADSLIKAFKENKA